MTGNEILAMLDEHPTADVQGWLGAKTNQGMYVRLNVKDFRNMLETYKDDETGLDCTRLRNSLNSKRVFVFPTTFHR